MRWWMKAALQYGFAHVPYGQKLYRKMQTRFGEVSRLETSTRFRNATSLLELTRLHAGPIDSRHVVELGTGWVPAVPLSYALAGAKVDTYDVQDLVSDELYGRTVNHLAGLLPEIIVAADVAEAPVLERIEQLQLATDLDAALQTFGGRFRAPFDTTSLPYEDGAVDTVVSSLVFQCIPEKVLPHVVRESFRILKPGGTAIHRICMTDELAGGDPHRNHLAYLSFSERTWQRCFTSSITHLNRWRFSQFVSLFQDLGFDVTEADKEVDWDSIPELKKTGIADEFRHLAWEDLATIGCTIVLRKPTRKPASATAETLNALDMSTAGV